MQKFYFWFKHLLVFLSLWIASSGLLTTIACALFYYVSQSDAEFRIFMEKDGNQLLLFENIFELSAESFLIAYLFKELFYKFLRWLPSHKPFAFTLFYILCFIALFLVFAIFDG